jgi:hypothetical protein
MMLTRWMTMALVCAPMACLVPGCSSGTETPVEPTLDTGPIALSDAIDPPARPSVRPIHPEDEVTPPAVDVEELRAQEKSR